MKEVERQKIWEKYTKNPTQEMREQIIIEYAPLVKNRSRQIKHVSGWKRRI